MEMSDRCRRYAERARARGDDGDARLWEHVARRVEEHPLDSEESRENLAREIKARVVPKGFGDD